MRLGLVAVGGLKRGPERDLCDRYRERVDAAGRSLGFSALQIVEIDEGRAARPADRIADEAARSTAVPWLAGSATVVFDERGRADVTSERFADRLAHWRDVGRPALALVVGGADGLSETTRARADLVVAFGALTLPHQLVRVLALEQLYRSMTILSGHPYHRGDPERR